MVVKQLANFDFSAPELQTLLSPVGFPQLLLSATMNTVLPVGHLPSVLSSSVLSFPGVIDAVDFPKHGPKQFLKGCFIVFVFRRWRGLIQVETTSTLKKDA